MSEVAWVPFVVSFFDPRKSAFIRGETLCLCGEAIFIIAM